MVEVQAHGFSFEKWVRDHFFSGYIGNYMQKWDVPSEHNIHDSVPEKYRNLPVSIKTTKLGFSINLGDVIRQFEINHDFLLIVGFWEQRTKTDKWIVDVGCAHFASADWRTLWGHLTLAEISSIDAVVKNKAEHYAIVQKMAKKWKAELADKSNTIVINPKIDSKGQRRVQCSLPYKTFWEAVGREPQKCDEPELWGHVFPNPIKSSARTFN